MSAGGLIGNVLSSTGGEGVVLANKGADYLEKSKLQEEAAEIARMRDLRIAELNKEAATHAEGLRRAPGQAAQAEIEKENEKPAYDPATDSVRPRTPTEKAAIEEAAYRRQGMSSEALRVRELEQQRADRVEQHTVQREQIASNDRYHNALLAIHQSAEGRLAAGARIDNAIKEISLKNAKRVEDLRVEFNNTDTTPARKRAIQEEMQLLTGKDNDSYLPVPTGFDETTGKPNGYRIFDKKRGTWVDDGGVPGGAQPSQADIDGLVKRKDNPQAVAFFESRFGKGSAARFLPKPTTAPPAAAPVPGAAPAPAAAAETKPQVPMYARYVQERMVPRSGRSFYVDAPARSPAARLNGRAFPTREAAMKELEALYEEE